MQIHKQSPGSSKAAGDGSLQGNRNNDVVKVKEERI